MSGIDAERQRRLIVAGQHKAHLTVGELWRRYFELGGTASPIEVDAFLNGALALPGDQRDRLSLAVNEHLDGLAGQRRAPYSRPLREIEPLSGPLAALTTLLEGTHLAPPDAGPRATDAAAARLGVRTVIYLLDYAQERLVPFPGEHGHGREPLPIDGTLPGRAFRSLQTQGTVSDDGQARLWVPIIDGAERLGVLDVMVDDAEEITDSSLRGQCWWLAHYLGHLLTALGRYGDAIDHVRLSRARTVQAELVWQLLPPLTAGTDKVVVSGRLEPCHDVGGDVFDYALSSSSAQVAVIDASGHDLHAGLTAAAALATYRKARHSGARLFDQAEAIHRIIADKFGGETFATAVLGELDVHTGLFRYLAAGHPSPLLLRGGKVVKALDGGRRPLLGLDATDVTLGEERLEPGDTVVIYTDGITEARDARDHFFGLERLADTLERASDENVMAAEMVRRVIKAILQHQGDVLQDDATLLLLQWTDQRAELDPPPLF
ncbi:MAG: serine/threonine-protein phosphatase [Actinomycetota bacterium]|nr:serine/threonine-protein phosphatase [Actinomycetota bacterium]